MALVNRFLDWIKSLFWKEEMELTLVGLQYSGKTTFVNVIAVSIFRLKSPWLKFAIMSDSLLFSFAHLSTTSLPMQHSASVNSITSQHDLIVTTVVYSDIGVPILISNSSFHFFFFFNKRLLKLCHS